MEEITAVNGWVKLYHPNSGGVQCTLPVPVDTLSAEQARGLFLSVERLLGAGFQVSPAGLMEGETREPVTHLARRVKLNQDGGITPVLDVYCGGNFKTLHVYLNTPQEISSFAETFGFKLEVIPLWEGDAPIERGKNSERDSKYILPVTGVEVVYKPNPKWEGEEDRKHPKRAFVRWSRRSPGEQPSDEKAAVLPASPASRQYANGDRVNGNLVEQQSYDRYFENFKALPDSREHLREWIRSTAGATVAR
jgi:hypothetical protein